MNKPEPETAPPPPVAAKRFRFADLTSGFTLYETLVAVAAIGILSSIALPQLFLSVQRGRQRKTMADIRALSAAVEAYFVDTTLYPAAGYAPLNLADCSAIQAKVSPTYIKNFPGKDGWGSSIYYGTNAVHSEYQIASYGADGASTLTSTGKTSDFWDDIVFENGFFTVYPAGTQQ